MNAQAQVYGEKRVIPTNSSPVFQSRFPRTAPHRNTAAWTVGKIMFWMLWILRL